MRVILTATSTSSPGRPGIWPIGPCQTGYKSPAPHLFLTQSVEYVNLLSEQRTSFVLTHAVHPQRQRLGFP